jgi:hypothetical protein
MISSSRAAWALLALGIAVLVAGHLWGSSETPRERAADIGAGFVVLVGAGMILVGVAWRIRLALRQLRRHLRRPTRGP